MVNCPFILRQSSLISPFIKAMKDRQASKGKKGITLTELLIVVMVIAILLVVLLSAFKPWTQQAKARDSRRKADLQRLRNVLEDYYNDTTCYPATAEGLGNLVPDYLDKLPTDPATDEDYIYVSDDCDIYRIYTTLEFTSDSEIVKVGCGAGCGSGGDEGTGEDKCAYNYGVSSPGENLECCTERCAGSTDDNCPLMTDEDLREHCGSPGCCLGSQWILTCPPGERPYCCPIEE